MNSSLHQFWKKIVVFFTPRSFLLKTKFADGVTLLGINKAGYGGRGIFIKGENIEPELGQLNNFIKRGDVFIDVGANSGMYSLKAAGIVKETGIVLAVEPSIEVLSILERSIKLNKFNNIRLRNLCAGDNTSVRTFWLNYNQPVSSSLSLKIGDAQSTSVLTVTLDELIVWEKLERVDYLKIDAEGAENEILSGAENLISTYRPIVQVEDILVPLKFSFKDYSKFKAPNSFNIVYIPNENDLIIIPEQLGWQRII